ncbi:MAG: amidohydrolase family protein [Flavobacteriales bacterium]|nr:amidohydrolase family protein [Flavobacteriales bacterium]
MAWARQPMQDTPHLAILELEWQSASGWSASASRPAGGYQPRRPAALLHFPSVSERLDMAVSVHPWDMLGKERMQKYWMSWLVGYASGDHLAITCMIFSGLLERLPKLRVAFAHGGGFVPGSHVGKRIHHGFEVRPDACAVDNNVAPKDYSAAFDAMRFVNDPAMLQRVVELFGWNVWQWARTIRSLWVNVPGELICACRGKWLVRRCFSAGGFAMVGPGTGEVPGLIFSFPRRPRQRYTAPGSHVRRHAIRSRCVQSNPLAIRRHR